jgi:hypothetical protein
MPHKLIESSGAPVAYIQLAGGGMMGFHGTSPATLAHMGATTKIILSRAGVYHFTTKAGEDYWPGSRPSAQTTPCV